MGSGKTERANAQRAAHVLSAGVWLDPLDGLNTTREYGLASLNWDERESIGRKIDPFHSHSYSVGKDDSFSVLQI